MHRGKSLYQRGALESQRLWFYLIAQRIPWYIQGKVTLMMDVMEGIKVTVMMNVKDRKKVTVLMIVKERMK